MLSVLKLNHNEADAVSLGVSVLYYSGHTQGCVKGKKGAWTARAIKQMSATHFYHLWSEARRRTMNAHNYQPGAWSTVYWSPLKGFHWRQHALDGPLELHWVLTTSWLMSAGALLGEFQDWLRCPVSSRVRMDKRVACKDRAAGLWAGSKPGPSSCILCRSLGLC